MKKLIFCDIDGTILDGSRGMGQVSDRTRYAIEELKKDAYFFLASGRCKGLLDPHIVALNPSGYILCNGAYAEINEKCIHAVYFDKKEVDKVIEVTNRYHGFYIFETLHNMYVDSLTSDPFNSFMSGWGKALSGFKEGNIEEGRYLIAMIGFTDKSVMPEVEAQLRGHVDLFAHTIFTSYDVNIPGINKATGVKKVIEYLGIPKENTYAFGDALNDLEMLESVGHPVIMKNGVESMKDRGFEETDDVLNDGFYNYLVSHKLIKAL